MQGLFAALSLHIMLRGEKRIYPSAVQAALQQYAIDFGDRRVMAGVHYPSDSMITWLICDELIPKVFAQPEQKAARKFLKASIRRSRLWRCVSVAERKDIKCVEYRELLDAVDNLIANN